MLEGRDHAERDIRVGIECCIYSMPGGDVLNASRFGVAVATAPSAKTTMHSVDSEL
jgi:hypothetical protein